MSESSDQYAAAIKAIDDETTRIGTKVEELVAKLAAGGMDKAEEAAHLAQLDALGKRMKTIAADPTDPVPEPTPEV
jgi:hypothetical protein